MAIWKMGSHFYGKDNQFDNFIKEKLEVTWLLYFYVKKRFKY